MNYAIPKYLTKSTYNYGNQRKQLQPSIQVLQFLEKVSNKMFFVNTSVHDDSKFICNEIFLEKLIASRLVKKIPAAHGIRSFIAVPMFIWVVRVNISKSLVSTYEPTRRHNPEQEHLHLHRRENLKPLITIFTIALYLKQYFKLL